MPMKRGGLAKLTEECGEVVQVCAKEDQVGGLGAYHWSGDLRVMLQEEIGDVLAAVEFVIRRHNLDRNTILDRKHDKLNLFFKWDKE